MKKTLVTCALLLIASASLHAQGGIVGTGTPCTSSPENPTAILAVVGSASAFFVSARARIRARRHSSK